MNFQENTDKKRIAVIGSGIAGHYAVHKLKNDHHITLFEAESRFGGHAHTVNVGERSTPVDMGFIVYNELTYPGLTNLFKELNVKTVDTDMSFGMKDEMSQLEYSTVNLNGLFAQRKNLFSPSYLQIWRDFFKFRKFANEFMEHSSNDHTTTLGELLRRSNCSSRFWQHFLYPITGAIWSTSPQEMDEYPATLFLRFMLNHRMLDPWGQPIWKTVSGGSKEYVTAIHKLGGFEKRSGSPVTSLVRKNDEVLVKVEGQPFESFDEVIVATHSDQALKMLVNPNQLEKYILSNIQYQSNHAILHSDVSVMPKNKRAWASWNVRLHENQTNRIELTYDMNRLQHLENGPWLVTLNPHQNIDDKKIYRELQVMHPFYDLGTLNAQDRWNEISGKDKIHYCGAYWRWGFHEDGLWSANRVVEQIKSNTNQPCYA